MVVTTVPRSEGASTRQQPYRQAKGHNPFYTPNLDPTLHRPAPEPGIGRRQFVTLARLQPDASTEVDVEAVSAGMHALTLSDHEHDSNAYGVGDGLPDRSEIGNPFSSSHSETTADTSASHTSGYRTDSPLVGAAPVSVGATGARNTISVGGSSLPKVNVTLPDWFDANTHEWAVWSAQVNRVFTVAG